MFFLAMKQLFSRKRQTFLILLGIALGTMLFVTISGVQLGFREYISSALLSRTAHVLIQGPDNLIKKEELQNRFFGDDVLVNWITPPSGKREESRLSNYQGWYSLLENHPDVYSFNPRLTINALVMSEKIKHNLSLVGTIPEKEVKTSDIEDYMKEGQFLDLAGGGDKIILGSQAAKDLGVRKGQKINVNIGIGSSRPFRVVGTFSFGDEQTDRALAFAHLNDVQALNRTPGRIADIAVTLIDKDKAQDLADIWGLFSKDQVLDWQEANKMFMEMIRMQDIVRLFITVSILIVAAFGIYNVLSIMINQKKKEIAILRSIGFAPKRILELILIQGIFLGVFGGLLGMTIGHSLNKYVETIDLGFEIGKSNHLLMSYDPKIYITAFWAALLAAILASILPAYSASKMTPMDIIRGE